MIYVLLANGFEEMEAIAPIDLLRRAGCELQTVAVGDRVVCGAHGIPLVADITVDQVALDELECVVLPGGLPGTTNLEASDAVQNIIEYAYKNGKILGAICAAPSIFGHKQWLCGKQAICYPGFEQALSGAVIDPQSYVVRDGQFITARGAGVATEFALALVKVLVDEPTALALREGIQCK